MLSTNKTSPALVTAMLVWEKYGVRGERICTQPPLSVESMSQGDPVLHGTVSFQPENQLEQTVLARWRSTKLKRSKRDLMISRGSMDKLAGLKVDTF
ncbi:unnamed protein product [Microthlaspi erraticum]|uniref:Uncharacterized protein n=1 Tax=Microthlaspi erraticum TaxID=1685480 RepID=A0A6D2K634_9BRAS|nr:unnamed protein product [Microthlaspi erraticum]